MRKRSSKLDYNLNFKNEKNNIHSIPDSDHADPNRQ